MVEEVLVLFAAGQGFLDEVPVSSIKEYEKEMLASSKVAIADVIEEIRRTKTLTDESISQIKSFLTEFNKQFLENNHA